MRAWIFLVVGVLIMLVGVIWTLQGLGYLAGSAMTGVTLWAILGPIVALAGLALAFRGVTRLRDGRRAP
jgi:hypothetical protein